jgi:hypothetical protein
MDSADDALEVVFETARPEEAAVVRSLFESAGLECVIRGEDVYDAFRGAFRGTVFSPHGRPVRFLVPSSRAGEARELLAQAEASGRDGGEGTSGDD